MGNDIRINTYNNSNNNNTYDNNSASYWKYTIWLIHTRPYHTVCAGYYISSFIVFGKSVFLFFTEV